MEPNHFLAFDLGATSGRTILGTVAPGKLTIKELTRFPNTIVPLAGHCYWNIFSLYEHIKEGLAAAAKENRWQDDASRREAYEEQAVLLRDTFGNPFRSAPVDPAWRTPTATAIAQSIYDERRFRDLPILADALEEAGCTNHEVLRHCREPGEHVRGCWVVDLVLGKE